VSVLPATVPNGSATLSTRPLDNPVDNLLKTAANANATVVSLDLSKNCPINLFLLSATYK